MRKIVSNFFISLDGVVEAPHEWHFPYFDDAMGQVIGDGMASQTTFLMGRRLYDEWSRYWTGEGADDPFSGHINKIDKLVLTNRPVEGELWNNTTVLGGPEGGDPAAELRALKQQGGGDIGMSGCATTVRWLLANDLLDELHLLVHPIAVGKGQRLFEDTGTVPLQLLSSSTLPTGVLHLTYAPAAAPE
ncbi:MAG TPA: dihydrofolate reductase family protein [Pseudonocardia sp.]|jgi:dihydrofolate reductase|nr:dihydrofolate reductase family protein [Pseudonocardia sp.]